MQYIANEKAGSAATLTSLLDATTERQASLAYCARPPMASKNVPANNPSVSVEDGASPDSERLPASVELAILLESGRLGDIKFDRFVGAEIIDLADERKLLDETEITSLQLQCECLGFTKVTHGQLAKLIRLIARRNAFDSAQEWLDKLPYWDGTQRVERFLPTYLGTSDKPYSRAVSRYVWTAMVARLIQPGCKADMMPVLVGAQGTRKSDVLKAIAPEQVYHADVCLTDRSHDLVQTVFGRSVLIWEEMQGIKGKCDFDRIKAFLSRDYIETKSHKRRIGTDRYPCRYLVFGTSNSREFLRDATGHRRYLPFEVQRIDVEQVYSDKLQLWAEALHICQHRIGGGLPLVDYVEAEALAGSEYDNYLQQARWVDDLTLNLWLERQTKPFSGSEALNAIGLNSAATQRDRREMANSLRQLGYRQKRSRVLGKSLKRWHEPTPSCGIAA